MVRFGIIVVVVVLSRLVLISVFIFGFRLFRMIRGSRFRGIVIGGVVIVFVFMFTIETVLEVKIVLLMVIVVDIVRITITATTTTRDWQVSIPLCYMIAECPKNGHCLYKWNKKA